MNKSSKKYKRCSSRVLKVRGKHFKEKVNLKRKFLIQTFLIFLICLVSSSMAYLIRKHSIINQFTIGKVDIEIIEEFDKIDKSKKNVCFKNTGNVPVYIRTIVTINWKNEKSDVLIERPMENLDYSIKFSNLENWIKAKDGFYYYKNKVDQGDSTDIFIEYCNQIKEYEGRIFEVSIACQAIQAEPAKVVLQAWNTDVIENGLLLKE